MTKNQTFNEAFMSTIVATDEEWKEARKHGKKWALVRRDTAITAYFYKGKMFVERILTQIEKAHVHD